MLRRLDISRSIVSLSKIPHQVWRNSDEETRQQKEQWAWGLEGTRKGCWTRFEKGEGRQYGGSL